MWDETATLDVGKYEDPAALVRKSDFVSIHCVAGHCLVRSNPDGTVTSVNEYCEALCTRDR